MRFTLGRLFSHKVLAVMGACLYLLTLSPLCAVAAEKTEAFKEDYGAFSVDLPAGWRVMLEPKETSWGKGPGVFNTLEGECTLVVSVVSSMSKTMKELMADAQRKAEAKGQELEVVESSDTRVVYRVLGGGGLPSKLISTLDLEAAKVGILVIMGDDPQCERVAKNIVPANAKLKFF